MLTKTKYFTNLIAFNIAWWALMLTAPNPHPTTRLIGPIVAVLVLALHFFWVSVNKKKDLYEVLVIAALGIILDSTLNITGVLTFTGIQGFLVPLWLIFIWPLFATLISYTFVVIRNKLINQIIVGGLFAPFSYITGAKLGLLTINLDFKIYYIIHALCWVVFFPLCFKISKKIKGY